MGSWGRDSVETVFVSHQLFRHGGIQMTSRTQLEKVLILNDRLMVGSNRPFRCLDLIDNSKYSPNEHLTLGKGLVPKY